MTYEIRCAGPRRGDQAPKGARVFNVTSQSMDVAQALSPFLLRPVHGLAHNVENYWQYSKVFPQHWDGAAPTRTWYAWRNAGWSRHLAIRHPAGKGAKPICSWIEGVGPFGYVDSRLMLYIPTYLDAVGMDETAQYALTEIRKAAETEPVWLWDFDVYDHVREGKSMKDLVEDETRPLGHGFLVWSILNDVKIPTPMRLWEGQTE